MKMDNYIIKTLAYNKQVRILLVDNTSMVKGNQRISLKVNASNRNCKIFKDADSKLNSKIYKWERL